MAWRQVFSVLRRGLQTTSVHLDKFEKPDMNPQQVAIRMILVGPPGSGKGTQAGLIQRHFGPVPISTGKLLRDEIEEQSPVGKEAQKRISRGELVPDDMTVRVLTHRLDKSCYRSGWMLDGFPRTVPQAELFEKFLDRNDLRLNLVLNLHASLEEVLMRLGGRLVHPSSGRTYHPVFNPPKLAGKDDVTGEPLVEREDDKPETIRTRMETYHKQTSPVLEYYKKYGIVRRVVVDGGTPDSVFAQVRPIMEAAVSNVGR